MTRSLRSWLWRIPIEQEVEEELAFHVEMRRRDGRPLSDEDIAQVRRACLETARKRDREMKLTQRRFEIVGRTFQASDEAGNNNVVVLGESLWRSLFAGNPDIVGRDVTVNRTPSSASCATIRSSPGRPECGPCWHRWSMCHRRCANCPRLDVIARLAPDVTMESARAELSVAAQQIAADSPEVRKDFGITIQSLRDYVMSEDLRRTSTLMLAIVGFVLLMCCANIANLLLARGSSRGREFAVRAALGASSAPGSFARRSVGFSSSLPYGTREFGNWSVEIAGDPIVDPASLPDGRVRRGGPRLLSHARSPHRVRPCVHRSRRQGLARRVHRQRGIRAATSRREKSHRTPRCSSAGATATADRQNDRRRGPSGERPSGAIQAQSQVYVPLQQHPTG